MATREESVEILETTVERVIAWVTAHVPLADDSAGVVRFIEHFRNVFFGLWKTCIWIAGINGWVGGEPEAILIASGEKTCATWSTHRVGDIAIRKYNPVVCEFV